MTAKGKTQVAIDLLLQNGFEKEAEILKGNDLKNYIAKKVVDDVFRRAESFNGHINDTIKNLKHFYNLYDEHLKE